LLDSLLQETSCVTMMDILALACQEVGLDIADEKSEETTRESLPPAGGAISQNVLPVLFNHDLHDTVIAQEDATDNRFVSCEENSSNTTESVPYHNSRVNADSYSSPIANLYSQRKTNQLQRSRTSKGDGGIHGVPCRNLSKQNIVEKFHLEVPAYYSNHDPLGSSNPFVHLFRDSKPGQVAFAFYVADCWFSFSETNILPDTDQFLKQCHRWWVTLPTPYRRGYWTKEMQYKNKMGIGIKGQSPKKRRVMVISNEKPKKAPNTAAVKRKKLSPSKDLREAFANFMDKFRMSVEEKLPGATGRIIRHELGKIWKSLSEEEKEKFFTLPGRESKDEENFTVYGLKNHDSHISEVKLNQALEGIPCENSNMDVDEVKDFEIIKDDKDNLKSNLVSITEEEIKEFAVNSSYYIENVENENVQELSSPERKILALGST